MSSVRLAIESEFSNVSYRADIPSLCRFQPFIAEYAQLEIREINYFLEKAIKQYLLVNLR